MDRHHITGRWRAALMAMIAAAALGAAMQPAFASSSRVLVELFTSQGCSSCPPADIYLSELSARDDVIALTLPVDYWDYLGWKDTLAMPAFTHRQKSYAERMKLRSVYTPQMIVDGVTDAVGSRRDLIESAIQRQAKAAGRVPLDFASEDNALVINIGAAPGKRAGEATVWLARYTGVANVEITRGENAGNTFTYSNVVRELTPIGMWTGEPLSIRLPQESLRAQGYDGCVVIVQEGNAGPVLGAAQLAMSERNAPTD